MTKRFNENYKTMQTRKFWCHYIGSDGNTPKRRNIELTDIHELLPAVSNEGVKTPVWYERDEDSYKQVFYRLYAQISDNVAVKILQGCLLQSTVARIAMTDAEIEAECRMWLDKYMAKYPDLSEERKQLERENCQNRIESDKRNRDRNLMLIAAFQDYGNYLLAFSSWIDIATIKAYEEVHSPILSGLRELRAVAMERREERERQREEEAAKAREEEARKKADEERREQERLDGEAEKFKAGGSIAGADVVELCRRYGIAIHLRTVHNLQQVIANINGKEGTCQYYRTRGKRRPQLDGCYKTAGELYNYLQAA